MMSTVKRVEGLELQLGGSDHRGWLPAGAAEPLATPVRVAIVDVRIDFDGFGYLLICESRNTPDSWDTWHETQLEAEEAARAKLDIQPADWLA